MAQPEGLGVQNADRRLGPNSEDTEVHSRGPGAGVDAQCDLQWNLGRQEEEEAAGGAVGRRAVRGHPAGALEEMTSGDTGRSRGRGRAAGLTAACTWQATQRRSDTAPGPAELPRR